MFCWMKLWIEVNISKFHGKTMNFMLHKNLEIFYFCAGYSTETLDRERCSEFLIEMFESQSTLFV